MISKGIQLHWSSSIEYVALDLDDPGSIGPITSTIEWWKKEKIWVKYNTTSEVTKARDGSVEIRIAYQPGRNPHLNPNDYLFGTTIMQIAPGEESGKAQWDDDQNAANSGSISWERVDIPLIGDRKKVKVSKLQRRQEEFRLALVAIDEHCVLSGERTFAALEAAHIIPASDGGAEVIENGILLRADLHRLFDAGLFSISAKGGVVVSRDLEQSYREMLKGKRLPNGAFKRVKSALEYVTKLNPNV